MCDAFDIPIPIRIRYAKRDTKIDSRMDRQAEEYGEMKRMYEDVCSNDDNIRKVMSIVKQHNPNIYDIVDIAIKDEVSRLEDKYYMMSMMHNNDSIDMNNEGMRAYVERLESVVKEKEERIREMEEGVMDMNKERRVVIDSSSDVYELKKMVHDRDAVIEDMNKKYVDIKRVYEEVNERCNEYDNMISNTIASVEKGMKHVDSRYITYMLDIYKCITSMYIVI